MARVFTPSEIGQGFYPQENAHAQTIEAIGASIVSLTERSPDAIVGAMFYGSAALGEPTVRSDVDLWVQYDDDAAAEVLPALSGIISCTRKKYSVDVDLSVASAGEIRRGNNVIAADLFFAEYLFIAEKEATSFRLGKPTEGLVAISDYPESYQPGVATSHCLKYISYKKQYFANHLDAEVASVGAIQKAFELPSALRRKLVRLEELRQGETDTAISDPRFYQRPRLQANLRARYSALSEHAEWLMQHNDTYSHILEETIKGENSLASYEKWLAVVSPEAIKRALQFSITIETELRNLSG